VLTDSSERSSSRRESAGACVDGDELLGQQKRSGVVIGRHRGCPKDFAATDTTNVVLEVSRGAPYSWRSCRSAVRGGAARTLSTRGGESWRSAPETNQDAPIPNSVDRQNSGAPSSAQHTRRCVRGEQLCRMQTADPQFPASGQIDTRMFTLGQPAVVATLPCRRRRYEPRPGVPLPAP